MEKFRSLLEKLDGFEIEELELMAQVETFIKEDDYYGAINFLKKEIATKDMAEAHYQLARVYWLHLKQASERSNYKDPESVEVLMELVQANYPEKIRDELERYLELAPNGGHAKEARVLLDSRNKSEIIQKKK